VDIASFTVSWCADLFLPISLLVLLAKAYQFFLSEVELNLHGLEGKGKVYFLVNSGRVNFRPMGNFVMEGRRF
jgi:hypothetical protein